MSAKVVCEHVFYAHFPLYELSKVFTQRIVEGNNGHVVQEVASGAAGQLPSILNASSGTGRLVLSLVVLIKYFAGIFV